MPDICLINSNFDGWLLLGSHNLHSYNFKIDQNRRLRFKLLFYATHVPVIFFSIKHEFKQAIVFLYVGDI